MNRRVRSVWLLAALVLTAAAAAPLQSQWRRLDSPNFIVVGEVGAGELRDIAVRFEGFRETLGRVLGEQVTSTAVPTVVLVFKSDASFTPFKRKYQGKVVRMSGVFVPRRDVNHIAMVSDGDVEDVRIIFHEYAHLLISNTGRRIPAWLNEGFAEYYSTFELQRGGREAVIGRIIESHLRLLNKTALIKMPDLLGVTHDSPLYNENDRKGVFYAQSWALTHMLLRADRGPQLASYLDQLGAGASHTDAWQRAFGAQDIARELDIYIRRASYSATLYKFTDRLATFEGQAAPVGPADAQAFLAGLQIQRNELDDGAARLAAAEKLEPDNARVNVTAATLAVARKDPGAAQARIRAAGKLENWFLNYLAGVTLAYVGETRPTAVTPADMDQARRLFAAARASQPEFANALARMAGMETWSAAGPTAETRAALERARSLAPGRHEYAMLLAQVLARQGQFEAARAVLGPLFTPTYPPEVREAAKRQMSSIVDREARIAQANLRSAAAAALPSTTETTAPPPRATGVTFVFRTLQPGEQRLEGTLERIECVVGKGVTFQVRSGADLIAITSPTLSSGIEYLVYRDDLKGSVQCGPYNPPAPVYATWRPGASPGTRIAVAFEFLPIKIR
jgi:hypothetical protein